MLYYLTFTVVTVRSLTHCVSVQARVESSGVNSDISSYVQPTCLDLLIFYIIERCNSKKNYFEMGDRDKPHIVRSVVQRAVMSPDKDSGSVENLEHFTYLEHRDAVCVSAGLLIQQLAAEL